MIALEVGSAARRPPLGGIAGTIHALVGALLRLDPDTQYALCYRLSRWRKGHLFRPALPNASVRVVQDPWNGLLLRRARLLHSMGISLPRTPRGIPKLVTVHDLNAVKNTNWVTEHWHERRTERIDDVVRRADLVVTYSRFIADEICEHYRLPAERVHPVRLGVDGTRFAPPPAGDVAAVRHEIGEYVMAVGVLTPRKNYGRLMHAVASLPPLRLVWVGHESNGAPEFRAAAAESKLGDRLVHLRSVDHERLVRLIAGARVFVVPSLYEGFGLTPLEAMAIGTPVVSSRAASLPEVTADAALTVDATDVEALRDAIARIAASDELAASLRRRGFARAREMSWERSARALLAVHRFALGLGPAPRGDLDSPGDGHEPSGARVIH